MSTFRDWEQDSGGRGAGGCEEQGTPGKLFENWEIWLQFVGGWGINLVEQQYSNKVEIGQVHQQEWPCCKVCDTTFQIKKKV